MFLLPLPILLPLIAINGIILLAILREKWQQRTRDHRYYRELEVELEEIEPKDGFRFCTETWNVRLGTLLDYGYYALNLGELEPILDIDGMMLSRPYPLDGSGMPQSGGPSAFPASLSFKPFAEFDYSTFSFS